MTLFIDDQSDPGSYADKFKDAPFYICGSHTVETDFIDTPRHPFARCYRDRKAHDKLIATTNEIRAKHGMEPL